MAMAAGEVSAGDEPTRLDRGLLAWLGVGVLVVVLFYLSAHIPFLKEIPETWFIPLADWVNAIIDWFLATFRWFFRAVTAVLEVPLEWVRDFLKWLPWPAMLIAVGAIGFAAGGWRLATFTTLALAYMVVIGYWDKTATTLSMAAIAVPISLGAGLVIGILGHRSARARRAIDPMLDLMQTIPTFAYLVPILVLFGVGPVVGILASAIYAIPPMVRNVMLGLERVPTEIVESATMSGSTGRQLLWWVKIPAAMPTILMGVNQTTMATLGMVVIAAMLGGIDDIGLEVFIMMKRAAFGESLLAGLVIALVAMILDRISRGFVDRSMDARIPESDSPYRRQLLLGAVASVILVSVLAQFLPDIKDYPKAWVWYPADHLNNALNWFTNEFFEVTSAIKTWAIFFFLLPLKLGLEKAVHPRFWGFELTSTVKLGYLLGMIAIALVAARLASWRVAVGASIAGFIYYFGTTGMPWPVFISIVALLAFQAGGWRVCLLAIAGLAFIGFTGMWSHAMISIQLCGAGVLISFIIGASLGVWAGLNDRVSAFLRPINDTLQTMPIFVFLIPGIMVFLVGEFTGLISIILYATVPSIRYTELGIRNVPAQAVEAARSFGTTRRQLLFQVQLPMALPEIMLGLNQTIMMGLAMVVVAALVGAKGLGSQIMIGITWGDTGIGAVAGLSIALIAIIIDRTIQSWSLRKKQALGLA